MFQITRRVCSSMTDREGRFKLFSALQLLQDCSEMWKENEPAFRDYLKESGGAQFLAYRQLEVLRVPRLGEELTCTTSVFDCHGAKGFRNTIITDAEGRPCYVSWCQGAFVARQTGRLLRIPQAVVDSMKLSPRYEMEYRERRITLPESPSIKLPPIAVQRNDIDYNHHVNNAHYVRMALEFLPQGFEIGSLRVEYKKPVTLGAKLTPTIQEGGETIYITLAEAGTPVCVMEFTPSAHSGSWFAW